jgi:hypothetical protein
MAPAIVVAAISATGTVLKAGIDCYRDIKKTEADNRVKVVLASLTVVGAAIAAAPKAAEIYRQIVTERRRSKSLGNP